MIVFLISLLSKLIFPTASRGTFNWRQSLPPPYVEPTERRQSHTVSQLGCWHTGELRRLLRFFISPTPLLSRTVRLDLKTNKEKSKKHIFRRTLHPMWKGKRGQRRRNWREMGAFRLLLGSLHYMGLYMQLSVATRQAGHQEIENHISGNGKWDSNFFFYERTSDEQWRGWHS